MTLVSVIIPTFNRLPLLINTIGNIKAATCDDKEIIVVDDASTDGTLDFIKTNFPEIIIVPNRGKGPGAARNTGMSFAKGNFIKFFDSDDVMSFNTLAIQCKLLQNSTAGFLYSPYLRARQDEGGNWLVTENVILNYHPFNRKYSLNYWMVRGLFLAIPSMLFKRELLDKVGPWSENTIAYEDWEYLWRIALAEPCPVHTSETVFLYRQHGSQTTINSSDDRSRDEEAVLVYEKVLNEYFNDYSNSEYERLWLRANVGKILEKNKGYEFFDSRSSKYHSLASHMMNLYKRFENKRQRLITGTNWPTFYGPETASEILKKYISYFN